MNDKQQGDNTAESSGAVYVFVRQGAVWVQQAYIKASNTDSDDRFGHSVALSGNGDTLAVGARDEDSADGNEADNTAPGSGAEVGRQVSIALLCGRCGRY